MQSTNIPTSFDLLRSSSGYLTSNRHTQNEDELTNRFKFNPWKCRYHKIVVDVRHWSI